MNLIYSVVLTCLMLFALPVSAEDVDTSMQSEAMAKTTMVNINTANAVQLSELKGIGLKKAKAIISYRETYGNFTQVNDLTKVKGIGAKFIEKNGKHLTL